MSNTINDEKNFAQVGQAVLYRYGWLCWWSGITSRTRASYQMSKWSLERSIAAATLSLCMTARRREQT